MAKAVRRMGAAVRAASAASGAVERDVVAASNVGVARAGEVVRAVAVDVRAARAASFDLLDGASSAVNGAVAVLLLAIADMDTAPAVDWHDPVAGIPAETVAERREEELLRAT